MTLTKEHAMASAVIWRQIFTIVNFKYKKKIKNSQWFKLLGKNTFITSTALYSAFNTHMKYIKSSIFSEF